MFIGGRAATNWPGIDTILRPIVIELVEFAPPLPFSVVALSLVWLLLYGWA
jgi:hypothetical protein